jgi:acetate kinase
MHILVINPGSSSIKFAMYADGWAQLRVLYSGELSDIGEASAALKLRDNAGKDIAAAVGAVKAGSMDEAISVVQRVIALPAFAPPDAVGYRVVHPGPNLRGHQRLTPEVLAELKKAVVFAPLHDPEALEMMEEMMRRAPDVPRFACFDTVFHETMPYEAALYALPAAVREAGVRRYGFHGLSCESVVWQMRQTKNFPFRERLIIAHLGSGCSVTACVDGKSVDTTMGLTPTGGVVMGTRPGDLDPGVIFFLLRQPGATVESVESMLNHEAGLKGLFGSGDMQKLEEVLRGGGGQRVDGEAGPAWQVAEDAYDVFTSSVRRAIGGMAAVHGVDAIVFTGGIGEHDSGARDAIASSLFNDQPLIDPWLNCSKDSGFRKISMDTSKIAVYVVPAEEDLMIARHVARMCQESPLSEGESR